LIQLGAAVADGDALIQVARNNVARSGSRATNDGYAAGKALSEEDAFARAMAQTALR